MLTSFAPCFQTVYAIVITVFSWLNISRNIGTLKICGVDILFFLFPASAIRHAWFPIISRKSIYPIFTKFGMDVYWVNSLHGIAFGEDSCIAN